MPLNVKNEEAHRLAKELADMTGRSITEAVTQALQEAVFKGRLLRQASTERLVAELDEIALHCASLRVLDDRSADEILAYNNQGLPV